ncbi:MAG: HAMP domain-containing sensor histidine kinase, partial [Acidobacteriota bacterium]
MRVTSKIIVGNGLLACLSIAILAYHASLVQRLVAFDAELIDKQSRTTALGIDLLRQADLVSEIAAARRENPGPVLERRLAAEFSAFHERLAALDALDLASEEREAFDKVQGLWLERMLGGAEPGEGGQVAFAQELRRRVRTLNLATQDVIEIRMLESSATGGRLRAVMWGAVIALAVVSVLLVTATLRSIIEPLRRLLEGTQAVAAGEYHHHLDDSKGDEFASVAASFNAMVRRLEQLDQTKKELIANVSHELKSPLAAMLETNRLLIDELPGPLNEQQRKLLTLNVDSGARLSTLISKMLDLSQMEAGGLDLELKTHDFQSLVKVVLDELEPLRREKKLQLELEASGRALWLSCDAERIV